MKTFGLPIVIFVGLALSWLTWIFLHNEYVIMIISGIFFILIVGYILFRSETDIHEKGDYA